MNYLALRTRTQYLRGEEDTAGETVINSHIQYAILDILNRFNFSWAKTVLTTQATNSNLPADINPKWGINVNDGTIEWTQISPEHSYQYSDGDHVFWITYVSDRFYLNAPSTETINLTYSIIPDAMTTDNDVCLIPDGEAVAYLAASKMYVGDERNVELKEDYKKEAIDRIQSLWIADNIFSASLQEGSILDPNMQILGD